MATASAEMKARHVFNCTSASPPPQRCGHLPALLAAAASTMQRTATPKGGHPAPSGAAAPPAAKKPAPDSGWAAADKQAPSKYQGVTRLAADSWAFTAPMADGRDTLVPGFPTKEAAAAGYDAVMRARVSVAQHASVAGRVAGRGRRERRGDSAALRSRARRAAACCAETLSSTSTARANGCTSGARRCACRCCCSCTFGDDGTCARLARCTAPACICNPCAAGCCCCQLHCTCCCCCSGCAPLARCKTPV